MTFVNDPQSQDVSAEADFVAALSSLRLFHRFHEDGLQDAARGGRRNDGVADTLDMEFWPRKTREWSFDAKTNRFREHRSEDHELVEILCKTVQSRAINPAIIERCLGETMQTILGAVVFENERGALAQERGRL